MKILILFMMLFSIMGYGQPVFQKSIYNTATQYSRGNSFVIRDGGYYLLSTDYNSTVESNVLLSSMDSSGTIIESKRINTDSLTSLSGRRIIAINDSSVLVTVFVSKKVNMIYEYYTSALIYVRNDSIIWFYTLLDSTFVTEFHFSQLKYIDGNIYCGGFTKTNQNFTSNPDTTKIGFIIKLDLNGNILWNNNYGLQSNEINDFTSDMNGNLILVGHEEHLTTFGSDRYFLIFSINSSGIPMWKRRIDVLGGSLYSIINVDSTFLIGGSIFQSTDLDGILVKMESNGDIIWNRKYGNSATGDDQILHLALSNNYSFVFSDGFHRIVKVDSLGMNAVSYFVSSYPTGNLNEIQKFNSFEIAAVGYTSTSGGVYFLKTDTAIFNCTNIILNYVNNNYPLVATIDSLTFTSLTLNFTNEIHSTSNILLLDSTFCISSTSIEENIKLSNSIKVYPNPVNSTFTFFLYENNFPLYYSIYDLMGRQIVSASIKTIDETKVDVSNLNSGLYIIKVKDYNLSLKIIKN